MKTKVTHVPGKRVFESPAQEVIPIQIADGFLASHKPPQNEYTYEEDLF